MSKDNQYQYWRSHKSLIRTTGDKAWALWHDPVRWNEWNWKPLFTQIGDWKWNLENHAITPEEAKAFVKYAYDLDEIPE